MTLNDLYGVGALLGFTAACRFPLLPNVSDPTVQQFDAGAGHVRVNVTWLVDGTTTAVMKIDCTAKEVCFLTLRSGVDHPTGIYTALCAALPDFFRNRGVVNFTATPSGVNSRSILRTRGAWDGEAALLWRVA